MKIGIDVDDVLADFVPRHVAMCNARFGKPAIGTLPVDWAFSNYGLTPAELDLIWQDIHNTPDFWMTLAVKTGVEVSLLQELASAHDLFFITSRAATLGNSITKQTAWWLGENLDMAYPTVLVTNDKGPLAAAIGLDYFIDDRPKNCVEIKEAVPTCRVFLKDTSHNQEFFDARIPRIRDVNEFSRTVMGAK